MNGSAFGDDIRPVFMCLESGHLGPYRVSSIYHRGVACRDCFNKAFPDVGEPRLIATEMRQQERRTK